jgi:hypothetical protein
MRCNRQGRAVSLMVGAIVALLIADSAAFGADIKQTFVRKFSSATLREKDAAGIVADHSGGLIPIENFEQARVLSTHWFTPRGAKDIFFKVQGNRLDYPSLCIVTSLEDQSLQDAGCVSMEGLVFYRRPTGALKFPDLVTILNGRKHAYKWNGSAYSD